MCLIRETYRTGIEGGLNGVDCQTAAGNQRMKNIGWREDDNLSNSFSC